MEITFLGTASCFPTPDRGVSCVALQKDGVVWLFDCGEGSQIQLQKSKVKPGKIRKIFITHLHGDHLFGLPGLMCTIGQSGPVSHSLEIYGPSGLREFVRSSLRLSYSLLGYSYVVHELCFEDLGDVDRNMFPVASSKDSSPCQRTDALHPNETLGRTIAVGPQQGHDHVICYDNACKVFASRLRHRAPCVGYVIQEDSFPGKLDVLKLKSKGINPGPICSRLKNGEHVTLPNGEVVSPEEVIGPSRQGRKVVILGDTEDSSEIATAALGADVVVHEATYEDAMKEKSKDRGHSTAGMAGCFAEDIQAKVLILTHFSQRYRAPSGQDDEQSETETTELLVQQANTVYSGMVFAAQDFLTYNVDLPT